MTTLAEFNKMCADHDWTHMMSDDPRVAQRGRAAEAKLREISAESPAHRNMYEVWVAHIWQGGPKPGEPDPFQVGAKVWLNPKWGSYEKLKKRVGSQFPAEITAVSPSIVTVGRAMYGRDALTTEEPKE